ncbi:MAG: cysteine--tRNA ligase [Candidatus Pacebacteria bacterium]|nr:cysteine--tRNA ligase [Candidatus Paceibacterota bacterium]
MKLYNSLSKEKEVFVPHLAGKVGMYHCGPTVYDHVHIGNLRSFLMGDFIRRVFEINGYHVTQVMNITDVGHLVSDGDDGDDKMTKALKREGKEITLENMIAIADIYAESFKDDLKALNMLTPHYFPKASDHIQEDIDIIQKLEEKGFSYTTSDGVYFNTEKMADYGKLGGLDLDKEHESRIGINAEKNNQADFALWKFDESQGWDSPWGQGFPGWHIECSGMAGKYLGEQFDIHTGGADLRSVHHNNEIAQSECATGCSPYVKYWMHGEMLNFGGAKLSKSTGGNITLKSLAERDINPLAYRYLAMQTHYRSPMNFTWEILESAQTGLNRVYKEILELQRKSNNNVGHVDEHFKSEFESKIYDDINIPQALAVFHTMMKSNISADNKLATAYYFDEVFGLGLSEYTEEIIDIPENIQVLLNQRKKARENKNWEESDKLRDTLAEMGYKVLDIDSEQKIEKL